MVMVVPVTVIAQNTKKCLEEKNAAVSIENNQAQSMLLNASSDSEPREINIGLPSELAETTILENGIPVTYDTDSQLANRVWRNDGSFAKVSSWNLYKTVICTGNIGLAMNAESGRGSNNFTGMVGFQTNSFGLLRTNLKFEGPLKHGFEYQFSTFFNYDPTSMRVRFENFLDKTQIARVFLNKKYTDGQIGIQYKFVNSQGSNNLNQNPYIYHSNGTVSKYNGLDIGSTAYIEKSGMAYPRNIWTGEQYQWNLMKETGSTSHVIDILGNHRFKNKLELTYKARLHYAESGFWNPNLGVIFSTEGQGENNRYVYRNEPDHVYNGNIQKGQMAVAKKWSKFGAFGRIELSKKCEYHNWVLGFSGDMLDAHNAYRAVYGTYMTIEDSPAALVHQKLVDGQWINSSDEYGCENPNGAIQYYDGIDSKTVLYIMDKYKIINKVTVDFGIRMELQRLNGYWSPKSCRGKTNSGINILIGKEKLKKNWLNKSGTANLVYNIFKNGGFMADILYAETSGKLSNYAQAEDPQIRQSQIQSYAAGIYYDCSYINILSKVNYIKRTNHPCQGNFENPKNVTELQRATVNYDVQTLGWTTDVDLKPFKGFNLHLLFTVQNPRYVNFDFTMFEQRFNYTGNVVRGVSKIIMEIEPTYQWDKCCIWGSARYFSKQYACFSNALYFAARWETFAGFNYKYDSKISFDVNIINLLNQTGAQGNIAGSNTITQETASRYYDEALTSTFIRPFTIEFKTTVKF